jgi:hypothetical protein
MSNIPSMSVEDAIAQTKNKARRFLLDRSGQPHKHRKYVVSLMWHTVLQSASVFGETDAAKEGIYAFRWKGGLVIYDPGEAEIFLRQALNGDTTSDELLCNAAGVMLDATSGIADPALRDYAAARLAGALRPTSKKGQGRSAKENRWRDVCIQGWLIPPLLPEFPATRNEATETESACSIVSQALRNIGIELSEKGVETVWNARPSSMKAG